MPHAQILARPFRHNQIKFLLLYLGCKIFCRPDRQILPPRIPTPTAAQRGEKALSPTPDGPDNSIHSLKTNTIVEQDFITITPIGLTRGVSISDVYILMLKSQTEPRIFPVLISKQDNATILRAMQLHEYPTTQLFSRLMHTYGVELTGIWLRFPHRGNACACLMLNRDEDRQKLTTDVGNGVALSLSENVPLLVTTEDYAALTRQQRREGEVALPLTAMSRDLLQEALHEAVSRENFELASALRDEIKLRDSESETQQPE